MAPPARREFALPSTPQPLIIDAHCHTFNASDLSVKGFLSEAVLDTDENVLIEWLDPLVKLAANAIGRAPGADEERRHLDTLHASIAARNVAAVEANLLQNRAARDAEYQANLAREIDRLRISSNRNEREFFHAILAESRAHAATNLAVATEAEFAPAVAHGISLSFGPIGRFIGWAGRLRHFRSDIIAEIISTYGAAADGVTLFASAMVDFAQWLNRDEPKTSPAEQIGLGGLLSRAFPGRIHFLAPFDPWRELESPATKQGSLYWVQEAVEKHGFIGVKVYPPMGFAAIGNAGLDFGAVGQTNSRQFGGWVDAALESLFDWAVENEVPVMAHCNASEFAKHDFASRPSPAYWRTLLQNEKYRGLRLNLGHFGGQDNLGSEPTATNLGHDWPEIILDLIDDDDHRVYTDVGNFNMYNDDIRRAWFTRLQAAMQEHPNLERRLMYGTDWMMLANSPRSGEFLNLFRTDLRTHMPDKVHRIMGANARDFFGLNPGDKARGRLEQFYDDNELPRPSWLVPAE